MPVYNAPLLAIDAKETRRYAGLQKAQDFAEEKILAACEEARLLAAPKGNWEVYDYDCETQTVKANPPCQIQGEKIGQHLAGCEKVIALSVTVGEDIEEEITQRFNSGEYSLAVLMDGVPQTEESLKQLLTEKKNREWRGTILQDDKGDLKGLSFTAES